MYLLLGASLLPAQSAPASATLTFHFEREGLPVPDFTLAVHPDGSVEYKATYAAAPAQPSRFGGLDVSTAAPAPPEQVLETVSLAPAAAAKIFSEARTAGYFVNPCESRAKNIAFTGRKTLSYTGPDGSGTCVFNYTENKLIQALTDHFLAIGTTLEFGRTLERKHRFDHLGLDATMSDLVAAQRDNRAQNLELITPTLQSIVEDTQLLERVRARASALLSTSK